MTAMSSISFSSGTLWVRDASCRAGGARRAGRWLVAKDRRQKAGVLLHTHPSCVSSACSLLE